MNLLVLTLTFGILWAFAAQSFALRSPTWPIPGWNKGSKKHCGRPLGGTSSRIESSWCPDPPGKCCCDPATYDEYCCPEKQNTMQRAGQSWCPDPPGKCCCDPATYDEYCCPEKQNTMQRAGQSWCPDPPGKCCCDPATYDEFCCPEKQKGRIRRDLVAKNNNLKI